MTVICCQPKCCIICEDTFDRPDSSDITVGATCAWTPAGSPSIDGLELKIPAGSSVTGPSCDRVRLRLRAAAQGNVCKITIGTGATAVVATITFGLDAANPGHVVLATDSNTSQADFPRIVYNPGNTPTVTLCVGKVGERGGAEFRDNDPRNDISAQMTADTPATPYGPVKLETISGTVWFNSLTLSYTKSATRPTCSKCNVRICPICFDEDFVPLSSTDCDLQTGAGTWVAVDPYVRTENAAAYLYTATGNPSGSRTMVVTAQWSWLSPDVHPPHAGHTTDPLPSPVRLYVAFSDVNNCHYVEFTKPTLTKYACVRLVRVVGGTKTVLTAIADVIGAWGGGANPVRATIYVDEVSGMIHLVGSDDYYAVTALGEYLAGPRAGFGTGNAPDWIDIDSLVELQEFQMNWYAGPGRTNCTHSLRGCDYAIGQISNDDFADLHCGVTAISGAWDWAEVPQRWNTTSANAWLQFNIPMDSETAVGTVYFGCDPNTTGGGHGLVTGLQFKYGWGMNGAATGNYVMGEVITSWVSPIGATIDWTLYIGGAPSATVRRAYCSGPATICIGGGMISIKPDMVCGYAEPVFYQSYTPPNGPFWGVGTGSLGTGSGASFHVGWISHAFDDAPDDPFDAYPPTAQICTPCAAPQYQGQCAPGVESPRWIRVVVAGVGNTGGGTDCNLLNGTYVVPVAEPLSFPRYVLQLPDANTPTNCLGHAGHQVIVTQSGGDIVVKIGAHGNDVSCAQCLLTFTFTGDAGKFCTGMTNEVSNSVAETGGLICVGGDIDLSGATCTLTSIP